MATFDEPLDRDHLARCPCGLHADRVAHELAEKHQLPPIAAAPERYERVVASAVMRAVFPSNAARRAFLQSVGASTALAALLQFFPLESATELFAQGTGAPEKKDLKVGCSGRDVRFIARPPPRSVRAAFPHTAPASGG